MASSQQMEVVEDSEPERQELRQKLKEDRRRRRGVNTKENHMTTPNSSVAVLQLSKGKAVSNGVIDISDDETPHVRNGAHPSTEVPNAPHKHDEGTQFDSPPVQRDETFEDQTKTGFKPAVLSNLNRLAFVAKLPNPPPRVSQSLSRTPSTDSVKLHHPQPPPRSNKSTSPASYGWDFSEIELSRLLKCISCGIKWTVRKSATQKLAHIKTCARKTHLSHETVKTLIQREINASSLSVAAGTSKGREKEKRKVKDQASVDAPPKTFLEHVVLEDSEGQKKRRRKHGPETVQSVSDTRGTILEKAKLLLQTAPLPPEVESTLGPPMTQAFGKSNLGQNTFGAGMSSSRWNVFTGRDPGYTVTKEYNECPPATQAFRTSRLGIAMKHSSTHPSRQNTPAPSIEHVNTQTALPSIDCTGKACRHDMQL
ncbi:hypothetical protein BD410DRAFT_779808 [Rickenella mellea]|uniref:Uncharacterized protein n=1 Tax=Rickenella mellea TaxID=50990 RepID=A0A4R5XGS9_9AGAM|nr:hypothetical protein BD410DRAFT_779808 [Rickenella mellea]